jgi:hypothetical protein
MHGKNTSPSYLHLTKKDKRRFTCANPPNHGCIRSEMQIACVNPPNAMAASRKSQRTNIPIMHQRMATDILRPSRSVLSFHSSPRH